MPVLYFRAHYTSFDSLSGYLSHVTGRHGKSNIHDCCFCFFFPQVHSREIIERLLKTGTSNCNAFEWMSQLRLYWVGPSNIVTISYISSDSTGWAPLILYPSAKLAQGLLGGPL